MSVILVTVGLVFGAYLYQPLWFDNGPYHYVSSHEKLADCEKAKLGDPDAICANGELYDKDDNYHYKMLKTLKKIEMGEELTLKYSLYSIFDN